MTKQAGGLLSVVVIIAGLTGYSITAGASTVATAAAVGAAAAVSSGAPNREKPDLVAETIIQFGEEGEPRTSKSKVFSAEKWRSVPGEANTYVICPGRFFSVNIASCREYSPGFLGFIGHTKRVPAIPIEEYLEKEEQKPISLNRLELREGAVRAEPSLRAHYHLLPGSGPAPVTQSVQASPESDADRETSRLGSVVDLGVVLAIVFVVFIVYRRVMVNPASELESELRSRERYLGAQPAPASPPTLQDFREIPSSRPGEVVATNSSHSAVQEERAPVRPGYRKIILDTGDTGGGNE